MDFDRIKKLIKLANGNTNDNEANSAARMVCKLLSEYKFSSDSPKPVDPRKSYETNNPTRPTTSTHYWDVYRRDNPFRYNSWRPGPIPEPPPYTYSRETQEEDRTKRPKRPEQKEPFFIYDEVSDVPDFIWDEYGHEKSRPKDSKMKKCSKCGWERYSTEDLCFMCRL